LTRISALRRKALDRCGECAIHNDASAGKILDDIALKAWLPRVAQLAAAQDRLLVFIDV
jgi:hypothetical protein